MSEWNAHPGTPEGSAGYRDRPISYQWRAPPELVTILDLPIAGNGAHAATRSMILAEALLGAQTGQAVSYSRRKVYYCTGKKYRSRDYTYTTTLRSVAELVRDGWLFEYRAKPNERGWQSSFCATPALLQAAQAFAAELVFDGIEPIRLKDTEGNLVDYAETGETVRLRAALQSINTNLKDLRIELPGVQREGQHLRIGASLILPIPGNRLIRIFSRGSFACHGRAYGWWQNIPKKVRCDLLIDGEATAEADYAALHPTILYCKRGLKFDGDAYDVGDFPRDHVKQGFNIAVNSPNRRSAIHALADAAGIGPTDANRLLAAIEHRHKPIGHAFCSDAGVRLMRVDSTLILSALKAANDDGFGALPIHDALVAPARCIDLAAEKMVEVFERVVGRANPCKIKIKAAKVPQMGGERMVGGAFPSADARAA